MNRESNRIAANSPNAQDGTIAIQEAISPHFPSPQRTAARSEATGVTDKLENHLLSVQQVADLLQVPTSWVYGRMRKRCSDRLPGYRLGKYWRFSEFEIRAWVKRQRGAQHAA
jgi:excisionase family DNA binding protein